jgi:DNA primase
MTEPTTSTREIKNYLRYTRNLSESTIIEWQLGLCPDWKVIAPELISAGSYKLAEACGLLRTGNGNTYDWNHHRITIPIHNAQGLLVGFGGRIIPGIEGSKYTNPPESPVYPKSKILFGLHRARRNFIRHGGACLVEGYFDVIKLHQCGWDNTIATCGTALTEDQAKLLKRYTDTVYIMRDGDKAGRKAMINDIAVLVPLQFKVYIIELPADEDPDTFFDKLSSFQNCPGLSNALDPLMNSADGIEWLCDMYLHDGISSGEASLLAEGIDKVVKLLAEINNQVRRDQYVKTVSKRNGIKATELTRPLTQFLTRRAQEAEAKALADAEEDEDSYLPAWVDKKRMEEDGFAQLRDGTKGYKAGIYFIGEKGEFYRCTNFTVKPLYHIFEQSNNRRLIEVYNGIKTATIEMPSTGLVNQNTFENELVQKGHFVTEFTFTKKQFKRVAAWIGASMPITYELKTLGWQPEGFFAYTNLVFVPETHHLIEYDDLGVVEIEDKHYISLANSKIHNEERGTDNPYENDLYLKYVKPQNITFADWAKTFFDTYSDNAPFGICFAFLTIFKDLVTKIAKMPMLYAYGPKGSGKSEYAESLTWLFFSGKNAEKDMIKGYNLNPGQGTPFSFFNRIERFRNCPILFNEFDENNIEDWKFGTFKAAYDGEGREVGDGDTYKKRKTKIQKVQGTLIIVGQYISIKDDGSVLSRSISCLFSLERLKNLTAEQIAAHDRLKQMEQNGLSALLIELLTKRPDVQKLLPKNFSEIQGQLMTETRGDRIEARLISNYSLILAAAKTMADIGILLPFGFREFYDQCINQVIAHNKLLKDNSAIHQFWKTVEFLFDTGGPQGIQDGRDLKIKTEYQVDIKVNSVVKEQKFTSPKRILYVRFSNVYSLYARRILETTRKISLPEDTLLLYMKEQPYFIGLVPTTYWSDKRTSGFAFDYGMMEAMGIVLEKTDRSTGDNDKTTAAASTPPPKPPEQGSIEYSRIPAPPPPVDDEPDFVKKKYDFEK